MLKTILVAGSFVLITGCAQTKFNVHDRDDELTATYDSPQHYFIGGLGQQKNIDPVAICGEAEKVARVETQTTFLNGLIANVTFGIYTPQQARVYCAK